MRILHRLKNIFYNFSRPKKLILPTFVTGFILIGAVVGVSALNDNGVQTGDLNDSNQSLGLKDMLQIDDSSIKSTSSKKPRSNDAPQNDQESNQNTLGYNTSSSSQPASNETSTHPAAPVKKKTTPDNSSDCNDLRRTFEKNLNALNERKNSLLNLRLIKSLDADILKLKQDYKRDSAALGC